MKQEEFIKRYTYDPVTDQLGKGGFGSVFKAYDNVLDCYVAIKIAPVDANYSYLRLKNEVDKAARLEHVNIAHYDKCLSFKSLAGEVDIAVMQYYENGSLSNIMDSGMLDAEHRYDILTQILEGLAYLHSEGIIHRDLKPQNVLIARRGNRYIPKITDFGISKQLDEGQSSAVSNSVLGGTRAYASPEQLKERTIRKNTDLWSFGVIAYQMLVSALPFDCGSFSPTSEEGRQEQFRQMMSGLLPEAVATIPEPWQRLIRECLTVDNEKRIAHAEDCLAIIRGEDATAVAIEVDNPATQLDGDSEKAVEPEPQPEQKPMPKSKSLWEQLCDLGFKMIDVKGGAFCMFYVKRKWYQLDLSYDVSLTDFAISETPITQAQWEAVMGTTVRQQRDLRNASWPLQGEGNDYPMYYVSYTEAMEFCRRLSSATGKRYTLPTEAQWEFAARGGNKSKGYVYSGSNAIHEVAWYTENSKSTTHPVKLKRPNELGLYDMSGNVWEWCLDWYGAYPLSKDGHYVWNPQGPSSGRNHVLRGGSWNYYYSACRVDKRDFNTPSFRNYNLGFRVVCLP